MDSVTRYNAVQFDDTVMGLAAVRMTDRSDIDRKGGTLVGAVMARIRKRIAARSLTPGAKLPSIRSFAMTMQVSTSTVVEAYERLVAERSEEHTSELQSLMRISYAVFCLKKKNNKRTNN